MNWFKQEAPKYEKSLATKLADLCPIIKVRKASENGQNLA